MTLPDPPTPPPQDRAGALTELLHRAVHGEYVVVGVNFTFRHRNADLERLRAQGDDLNGRMETVECEPTALLRHRHGLYAGLTAQGLLHRQKWQADGLSLPEQDLRNLPDDTLGQWMLRGAQAWFAEQEQTRVTRETAYARTPWARLNLGYLAGLIGLIALAGFITALFVTLDRAFVGITWPPGEHTSFFLRLFLLISSLFTAGYVTLVAVATRSKPAGPLRTPRPVQPPRTLALMPGEYWHLQVVPATTPGALPSAAAAPRPALAAPEAKVRSESLALSRATLERSRAELSALRAQADPDSSEAQHADQLLARTDEALALVTQMDRPAGLRGPLDDLERTIDTELHYLSALGRTETS